MPETIELHPAWMWDCPDCGVENFDRSMVAEITPDEAQEMAVIQEELAEEMIQGQWVTAPLEVTCKACGHIFKSEEQQ